MNGYFGNLRTNSEQTQSLKPAARTASATGTQVDLKNGYEHAIQFNHGAWTDGVHTFTIMEATRQANGTAGTFTAVDVSDLDGDTGKLDATGKHIVDAANEDDQIVMVTYTGGADFLRVDVAVTGSPATGMVSSATIITTALRNAGNTPGKTSAAF